MDSAIYWTAVLLLVQWFQAFCCSCLVLVHVSLTSLLSPTASCIGITDTLICWAARCLYIAFVCESGQNSANLKKVGLVDIVCWLYPHSIDKSAFGYAGVYIDLFALPCLSTLLPSCWVIHTNVAVLSMYALENLTTILSYPGYQWCGELPCTICSSSSASMCFWREREEHCHLSDSGEYLNYSRQFFLLVTFGKQGVNQPSCLNKLFPWQNSHIINFSLASVKLQWWLYKLWHVA